MTEPSFLDALESRILFPATRLFSWFMVVVLLITAFVGIIFFRSFSSASEEVTYESVKKALMRPSANATKYAEAAISSSAEIAKHFNDDKNRAVLESWLADLDASQRSVLLSGLSDVIRSAERENPDSSSVSEAVNTYRQLQIRAFAADEMNRSTIALMRNLTALAILILLGMSAVFALVIAILSLERKQLEPALAADADRSRQKSSRAAGYCPSCGRVLRLGNQCDCVTRTP